jgi:hypothetical protein
LISGGYSKALAAEAGPKLGVEIGFDFASGDYGTSTTTDSYSIPLKVRYTPTSRLGFELTIPYIYQNNSNTLYAGGIRYNVMPRQMAAASAAAQAMGPGGAGAGTGSSTVGYDVSDSASGLGDITLTGGYVLVPEAADVPQVRPLVYVKFPTGDKNNGLGTGELDFGGGLSLSKWFGPWNLFGESRYIVQGSNDALGLKNYVTYEGDLGYAISRYLFPQLVLWGATAPADNTSSLLEAKAVLNYRWSPVAGGSVYVLKGLATSSPDYGFGLSFFRNF